MLSHGDLRELGRRLREQNPSPVDVELLAEFRQSYDNVLMETAQRACATLRDAGIPHVLAGRSKRTISIIRKLRRQQNTKMELWQMRDIAGLRVVVDGALDQDGVAAQIRKSLDVRSEADYRNKGREYRAIHLVLQVDEKRLEIQVRTLPQQLWADESESFGETVKEGGGAAIVREYLKELSAACTLADGGASPDDESFSSDLMLSRRPFLTKLPLVRYLFGKATQHGGLLDQENSYIIVYDSGSNRVNQQFPFGPGERAVAAEEYRKLCELFELGESRYEVLILNSTSPAALAVTHFRFFTQSNPGVSRAPGPNLGGGGLGRSPSLLEAV